MDQILRQRGQPSCLLQGYVVCMIEHADGTAAATKLAYGAGWLFYEGWGTEEVRMSQTRWVIARTRKAQVGTLKRSGTGWQCTARCRPLCIKSKLEVQLEHDPQLAGIPHRYGAKVASGKQALEEDSQELSGLSAVETCAGLFALRITWKSSWSMGP